MDTFVDLPRGKGIAGGFARNDAEYTLKCILLTGYNRVCVTDGKLALVRMVVTP